MRVASRIVLTDEECAELVLLAESSSTPARLALRARMVLLAAQGMQNTKIARQLGAGRVQVARWRDRYEQWGLSGIESEAPRSPRPQKIDAGRLAELTASSSASSAWSTRQLASELGVSAATVSRHLRAAPEHRARNRAGAAVVPRRSGPALPQEEVRKLMPREGLAARLAEAGQGRCLVIQAQAGSGKTATMLAWRKTLLFQGFDAAWFSPPAHDGGWTGFLQGMLTSIGEVDPDIVREAARLIGRETGDAGIEHGVIALVRGFTRRPQRRFVLMIDDMHRIEDRRIFQALQWLLDYAPDHLYLAFSSRHALPLSFERPRAQGMLTELSTRDLRFSVEETARYLREQMRGPIGCEQVRAAHDLTEGWVTGLKFFVAGLRVPRRAPHALQEMQDASDFANYFEREVVVKMAPEDLDMLTQTAVCERLCAPLCAAVMGLPQARAGRMAMRLAGLELDNFFMTRVDSGPADREIWYRLHPLLRKALLLRLARYPAHERRASHSAAWKWFARRDEIHAAVSHAVQAGAVTEAADLVQACGYDLLARGEIGLLTGLLHCLPAEQIEQRFDLHVLMAYLFMYDRNSDALKRSLRQMHAQAEVLDEHQRYYLVLLQGAMAAQRDDPDTMARLVPEVLKIPRGASGLAWSGRSNVLSWAHMHRGDFDTARRIFEESDEPSGAPRSSLLGRCMSAMSLAHQGQGRQAEQVLRGVLRIADLRGESYRGISCMAASVLADILRELDDMEAVCSLLEARVGTLERSLLPELVLRGLRALAEALWSVGRSDEAWACVDRLEAYAQAAGVHRLHAEALQLRLRRHLWQGQTQQAMVVLERVETQVHQHGGTGSARSKIVTRIRQAGMRARVEVALWSRDWRRAEKELGPLVAEMRSGTPGPRTAEALMQSAIAQKGLGEAEAMHEHALAAIKLGHQLGLVRTLLDVSPEVPGLLQTLYRGEATNPVLEFYIRRLEAVAARPQPGASPEAATPVAEVLSEREYQVLTLLAQAMPNKKIAKVIHISPDTVKFHLKNIYAKLGVAARDEAVARLHENAARKADAP